MKILRTIESFYPFMSGPANQAYMISKKLKEKNITSSIFTTDYMAEESPSEEDYKGIPVRRFKVKGKYLKYLYTPQMKKEFIRFRPDLIHAHNYRSYQSEIAYKAAKKLNIPFIINTHGGLHGYKKITKGINKAPYWSYDLLGGKKHIKRSDAVIVSSNQEYGEALDFGVKKQKLHIVPMGIDVNDYRQSMRKRDDDKIVLLFVGRITKDRNLMPMLDALKDIDDRRISLRIVGGEARRTDTDRLGYLDLLRHTAAKYSINSVFTGPKYGKDLINEYMNADIFIYTSVWENFGQTLLEAGAAGLPIISTRVGIAEDIVKDEKTGYLVSHNSTKEIEKAVRNLMDKKKRESFGKSIHTLVKKGFAWDRITEKYAGIYEQALKNKKR